MTKKKRKSYTIKFINIQILNYIMVKRYLIFILLLLSLLFSVNSAILINQSSENGVLGNLVNSSYFVGENYTIISSSSYYNITQISISLVKVLAPTGNVILGIYTTNSTGHPQSLVCNNTITATSVSTASAVFTNFTTSTCPLFNTSTQYILTLTCPNCTSSNYIIVRYQNSNVYTNGVMFDKGITSQFGWTAYSTVAGDMGFLIYGNETNASGSTALTFSSISLTNNTYFNTTNIQINTTILNTSTNGDINQTAYLYYATNGTFINSTQYATNNLNGTLNYNSLTDNIYIIWFRAFNNVTNVTIGNYTLTIDRNAPTTNNINATYYAYNISGFNSSCSDTNLLYCNITINGQTKPLNTTSFNFTTNGNQSYNITALDLAGNTNTTTGVTLVNPYAYVYFVDSSSNPITNFVVNGTNYTNYFNTTIYPLGLGTHTFNFSKSGYINTSFTLTFNSTSTINQTLTINTAYINIYLYDVATGLLITPNNYSIFFFDLNNSISQLYTITNNNTILFLNPYSSSVTAQINLFNTTNSLLSTRNIINPNVNVTIDLYVNPTASTILTKTYTIYTADLVPIQNSDVNLYANVNNSNNFLLQTTKQTNLYGEVTFDILPNTLVYNICNTYSVAQKCDNARVFDTTTTGYSIVHDSTLNFTAPVNILGNIEYSFSEVKTDNSTTMTFTFDDLSLTTERFCYNVTRVLNNSESFVGLECMNTYTGQIIQNYSLLENSYLKFVFMYYEDITETPTILATHKTYYPYNFIGQIKELGILNYLFLAVIFIVVGFLLDFKSRPFYSIGFLGATLCVYALQSYLNSEFMLISIWGIMVINHLLFWYVNTES